MTSVLRASTVILAAALVAGAGGGTVASAQPAAAPKIDASGFVTVGPDRLFYEEVGQGPAIVLIHDGTIHREIWDDQVAFFAAGHRVVRYDRRGYGKSSAPTVSFSNVDDLAALFDQLKIDKACLIGMSAGGMLAVDFTLRHPEKVTSLVLVGAVVGGLPYTRHIYDRGGHLPKIDGAVPPKTLESIRLYFVTDDPYTIYVENAAAKAKARRLVLENPRRPGQAERDASGETPAYRRLSEINVPTLILVGEFDIPDVHAHAGALNGGIKGSRRETIRRAAHLIPLEQPEAFNMAVGDFLATSPRGNVEAPAPEDAVLRKIEALVKAHAKLDMFSGTVLVARRGEVIYEAAVGEADKDHRVPNRADTRFNVGSIGKTFTAVSIMQLVQNGRLRLTDTLDKFLPEYPFPEKATITIEHLLTHSSGLGDYLMHPDYRGKMVTLRTVSDKLALVYSQKPEFPAGERYQYSNSGFLVLGAIIEKVSGMSYPAYLEKHVLQPAGMTDTGLAFEDEVVPNRSIGYTKNWDGTYTSNILVIPPPCPAGGIRTTARDLLKFDRALSGSLLLSEASKARMFAPSRLRPTLGLGWEVKEYQGHRFVGHSGGADGVEAFFYRFIDDGYTLVTLSNYDRGNGALCSDIEAILFGQAYELPTLADAHFLLGYGMQSEGKHREAVKVFARNLETEPPHLMSLFMAANSRILGGFELEKAVAELDRYIALTGKDAFPPASMAWARKGAAFKTLGRIDEAIGCYRKVLELDPQDKAAEEQIRLLQAKRLP